MADVRALLKAKRAEARITHPLASYNKNNELRCTACGLLVKHASAWEGHLGSKQHRTTVARLKEEEKVRAAQRLRAEGEEAQRAQVAQGKRKADVVEHDDAMDEDEDDDDNINRRAGDAKRRKVGSAFPTDFFSDPTRSIPVLNEEAEEEGDVVMTPPPIESAARTGIDLEYERFQRELRLNAPDERETYQRATIFAEPELVVQQTPEGFPVQLEESESMDALKRSEEEARQKMEQEERELIMDRLLDEERAQEEADMRVTAMKARLDAMRMKREARKAAKASKFP